MAKALAIFFCSSESFISTKYQSVVVKIRIFRHRHALLVQRFNARLADERLASLDVLQKMENVVALRSIELMTLLDGAKLGLQCAKS